MNYDEFTQRLTDDLEPFDPDRLAAIRARLAAEAAPVKPLPPDRTLIGVITAAFLGFTLLGALLTRILAPHVLSPVQMAFYYGLILICAVEGAAVVVGEMIPGSELRSRSFIWTLATAIALPLLCILLFRSYDTERFVQRGLACLETGSVAAIAAGVLVSMALRLGFAASQRSAARAAGLFAALAGVAVLALHCPLLSVPHILIWHFSVLLIGWAGGDLVGWRMEAR